MKKLTIVIGIVFMFSAWAQVPQEASWKASLRSFITKISGPEWSNKILGLPPRPQTDLKLPDIPRNFKMNTNVDTYSKKTKESTEYDRLPNERKRQFNYKFIEELFLVTRKTEARDEDLSNWLNTLDQGGSREGIYQALVLDEVYSGLESIDEAPTKRLLDFCLKFSQDYLNQTFKEDSLKTLNLYSLKRIITEKGLDLLEYYETKDLDGLYRWYALASADFAYNYGPLLKSDIRSETNPKFHYEWAKGMPIQHIKSEFIIKIHSIMNGLQLLN